MCFEPGLTEVFVQPGELCLMDTPAILRTILGSCVGIIFWIPRLRVGAMCHPMLPLVSAQGQRDVGEPTCYRYVDSAIRRMARKVDALCVMRRDVQVKLFGGADVLHFSSPPATPTVGQRNRVTAVEVLREEGLRMVASSLGGDCGMQILFHTGTGEVRLRRLS
jgi:chemotaxis protein CheD